MYGKVTVSAQSLRFIMGEAFDGDEYERGRKDCRDLAKKLDRSELEDKLTEVKNVLANGNFRHRPGPSYWIGCLCEFDFIVWPKEG